MTTKKKTKTKINEKIFFLGIRIPQSLYKPLVKASKEQNVYMSEFIRNAIEESLEQKV